MPSLRPLSALLSDPVSRAMLAAGGVWLWDHDLTTEVTEYQPGFWEQYGYSTPELSETFDFLRVVHTRDLREITKAWRAHLDGETPTYECQWRLRTAGGEWRWLQSRGQVTERDAEGRPTRVAGAYTDITSVKRSEQDLATSNAELDAVYRSSRDGLALVAADFTLLRANDAAISLIRRLTGVEISEGESVRKIPAFAEERPVMGDLLGVLGGGADVRPRVAAGPSGGGWAEFSYSPVLDPAGGIFAVAVTIRDITEKVRLEQARMQTLRLESLGLIAGGVAHDFNNLLGAVIGNIDLAARGANDPDTASALSEARQAARRASELVQQLLAFAAPNPPVTRRIDFASLAREMVRYAGKIPGNRTPVREYLPAGLPQMDADPNQLRQLVLNLVVNALEATREQGTRVTVRAWTVTDPLEVSDELLLVQQPAPRYIALEVSDDGPGMAPETVERIFDPFFTTKPTGHGLGLPSVLGAVKSHGGTIAVKSVPGEGAAFTVFLPCP